MKKTVVLSILLSLVLFSCIDVKETSKKQVLEEKIQKLEKKYFSTEEFQVSKEKIDSMINLYESFITAYPKDSITPYFKFKQANLYSVIQNYKFAVKTYDEIYREYPDFINRPEALFYEAMLYGDYLKNEVMAQIKYKEFIKEFPNHQLKDDAEKSIEFLGKTDEEIIEMLTKKDSLNNN